MRRTKSATLALTLLLALSAGVSAETSSHRDARIFVNQTQIGRNLPGIALSVAQQTVTFTMISNKLGRAQASTAVSNEIKALLPKYQPKWDENIAQAFEKNIL